MKENYLIAEFMGLKKGPIENCIVADGTGRTEDVQSYYESPFKIVLPHQLPYDTSWDWLMPVVEKIANIYCEEIENRWTHEEERKFKSVLDIKLSVASTPDRDNENEGIEFVHAKVVEFIKWYNSNLAGQNV